MIDPSSHTDPEISTWPRFNARDAHDSDSSRSDSITILFFFAIIIPSIFATSYLWFYHGKSLNLWLGTDGILAGFILIAIIIGLLFLLAYSRLFKVAVTFFISLYHPPEDVNPAERIRMRFLGVPPVPPPMTDLMNYPFVIIKEGKVDPSGDWITWLGGPARLVIFDGNAAYVERGKRFSRVIGPTKHLPFLDPTEKVKAVVDLHPRLLTKPGGVRAWTKDGIRVKMDVSLECQIGLEGMTEATSHDLLFPYGPISVRKAVEKMAVRYDQEKKCLAESDWADGVWGQVQGKLASYVFSHTLDELFLSEKSAGQLQTQDVVAKIVKETNAGLVNFGTRLVSLQITNIAPVAQAVNEQRIRNWESRKQSAAAVSKGQAEAYRIQTEERARAEAESDLIYAITEGLRNTSPSRYDEQLVLSLSGILDQSLNNSEMAPYIPGETLNSLKQLRELLHLK
jgi:hypothetical protein